MDYESMSRKELAAVSGFSINTISARIHKGMSKKDACLLPFIKHKNRDYFAKKYDLVPDHFDVYLSHEYLKRPL